ncbi:SusE domain-containing protein [Hymenobacter properus]|uniref:SusE domain-containing protein n=1 Tax=Hymenobacter properus TaxID=2791026 RepID=A0A931FI66_9BACT|nr:SusE domain-containing protein [Hymenobacter properus]MBF9140443.1 SusE domain-containing protein [Hymenobacter properus]MBR7719250.1 SusE domain-containing protein [Microvirga sp. SRT04]
MKNWLTQVTAVAFAVATLASCQKDEDKVTVTPSATPTLTASANTLVLAQANGSQNAITYTWTPVKLNLNGTAYTKTPAVTYQLQLSKTADGFGYPAIIDGGSGTSKTITVSDLNTALTTLGLKAGTATPVFARVAAVAGSDAHTFVSNPVPLTATSYTVCLPPAGSHTWSIIGTAGVDWNTDLPMTYNCTTNTFDVTRNMNAGEFKFRADGAWTLNYGSSSSTGGPVVVNGPNIAVTTAGVKTIKLNINTLTYTIQ